MRLINIKKALEPIKDEISGIKVEITGKDKFNLVVSYDDSKPELEQRINELIEKASS